MANVSIRQSMILAAGLGKRLRPLTLTTPKPLIPLKGIPLLQRAIDSLSAAQMDTIVINTHYLGEQIEAYIENRAKLSEAPQIILSSESEILETGGGIAHARKFFKDGPLITVNSDICWDDKGIFDRLCANWDDSKMDALLVLVAHENTLFFKGAGDFNLGKDGRLSPRGTAQRADYVYTGIQLIDPERLLKDRKGHFGLSECYLEAAMNHRLYGVVIKNKWSDVGTIDALVGLEEVLGESW